MNDTVQHSPATQSAPPAAMLGTLLKTNFQGTGGTSGIVQDPYVTSSLPVPPPASFSSQSQTDDSSIFTAGSDISTTDADTATESLDQSAENLRDFEEVLNEINSAVPHGVVQAVDQATDTLNPQQPVRSVKERVEQKITVDTQPADLGGGLQTIEQEKVPEIPVEVESFLQRVEDHHETAPTEVIIADGTTEVPTNAYPSRPVIVLPISVEEEKEGAKKSTKFSFRWLVEFSHKIIRMFTGKVIYRQEK